MTTETQPQDYDPRLVGVLMDLDMNIATRRKSLESRMPTAGDIVRETLNSLERAKQYILDNFLEVIGPYRDPFAEEGGQ